MKRRLLISLGSATGLASVVGSDAFTSASADRYDLDVADVYRALTD